VEPRRKSLLFLMIRFGGTFTESPVIDGLPYRMMF